MRFGARHSWLPVAVGAAALTALLSWLLGPGLSQYLQAQGMDDERAYLLTAVILVILATAVLGAASRRPAPTRVGGLIGFVGIQIVPFLIRAASEAPPAGFKYQQNIPGWILQPLGMLLLALVGVIVGAALGVGLARDATHLPAFFRRRRTWPAIPVAIALVVVASSAATTALQDGPLGSLRTIDETAGQPAATPTPSASATAPGSPLVAATTPTPDLSPYLDVPGKVEYLTIANRQVDVYVPNIASADPSLSLPVLYLLHGTPGEQADWLTGGQLKPILDQDIAAGRIPPMIVVLPNGNTVQSTDTEWGNSPSGDVESWIVNQVVPAIHTEFNTLTAYCGIAGLSSGGYGAVNIAFQNPTVFSWAASYSGYFVGHSATFGSEWRANSPLYTASTLPIAERMPIFLGAGSTDYDFKADTVQFESTLYGLGWPQVDYQMVPGGHGWVAWQNEMVLSLDWLGELWGPDPWSAPLGPPYLTSAGRVSSDGAL
ncbi:MAG: alpha/beta hydrolase-fold protein [Candidatus Dormibacteria bacterium]|jgi:enterochelin esterase-like enzyme